MVHVSLKPFKFPWLLPEQTRKLVLHGHCITYNLVHLVLLRKFLPVQAQITQPVTAQQRWPLSRCNQQGETAGLTSVLDLHLSLALGNNHLTSESPQLHR